MKRDAAEAAEAREELRQALLRLAEAGRSTPCARDDRFTADSLETMQAAAQACVRCPVQVACDAAGAHEVWGVWSGRVLGGTRPTGRKPTPSTDTPSPADIPTTPRRTA